MFPLGRLAETIGGRTEGDASFEAAGLKGLADAGP